MMQDCSPVMKIRMRRGQVSFYGYIDQASEGDEPEAESADGSAGIYDADRRFYRDAERVDADSADRGDHESGKLRGTFTDEADF